MPFRCWIAIVALVACCAPGYQPSPLWSLLRTPELVARWQLRRKVPHRPGSFTEGLVFVDGRLFESVGQRSALRELDPKTGVVVREQSLPAKVGDGGKPFGEGLAAVGASLIQLTWQNHLALVWDLRSFRLLRERRYQDAEEGWGVCFDGKIVWRSTGSSLLLRLTPGLTVAAPPVPVTVADAPLADLNELECIGQQVFANVWHTPFVVVVNPDSGRVVRVLDLQPLVDLERAAGHESVLNGIAWDAKARELYVTGKNWSHFYVLSVAMED